LLGLADAAAVDGFVEALLTGDAAAGIGILDLLEERGRDPRALLDQVVDAVRSRLVTEATSGGPDRGANLTAVARRLVAIDPDRAGIGGLRLQLELALFAGLPVAPATPPAPLQDREAPPIPATSTPVAPEPRAATQPRTARASGTPPAPISPSPTTEEPKAGPGRAADAAPTEPPAAPIDPAPVTAAAPTDPAPVRAAGQSDAEPVVPSPQAAEPQPADTRPGAAEAPSAAATNGTELTLDRIVAAWPDIVTVLSRQPVIKPLIQTCRPVALDGVIVTLGFPEEQAFLREIAERKKAAVEAGIREVIGLDVGVRCVVANIEVAAAPLDGEDGFLMAEARRIFGDDLADVVEID
jgi:DNA polymerase III subunit gamma/tau